MSAEQTAHLVRLVLAVVLPVAVLGLLVIVILMVSNQIRLSFYLSRNKEIIMVTISGDEVQAQEEDGRVES